MGYQPPWEWTTSPSPAKSPSRPARGASLTFSVAIPDDQMAELPENFRVGITGYAEHLSCAGGLVVDEGTTTALVHINDNDSECRTAVGWMGGAWG